MRNIIPIILLAVVLGLSFSQGQVLAADWGSDTKTETISKDMKAGRRAIAKENYEKAVKHLTKAVQEKPKDADAHNLLGYSYRKLGNKEKAFEHYFKSLELEPKHRGANEYLGELYLETDQLAKAEERLQVLDKACFFPCEEYRDLKEAIDEYKKKKNME